MLDKKTYKTGEVVIVNERLIVGRGFNTENGFTDTIGILRKGDKLIVDKNGYFRVLTGKYKGFVWAFPNQNIDFDSYEYDDISKVIMKEIVQRCDLDEWLKYMGCDVSKVINEISNILKKVI